MLADLREERRNGRRIRDVGRNRDGARADGGRCGFGALGIDVADNDARPICGQPCGNGLSDTLCRASHQCSSP